MKIFNKTDFHNLHNELQKEIAGISDRQAQARLKGDDTHARVLRFRIKKRINWLKDIRALLEGLEEPKQMKMF